MSRVLLYVGLGVVGVLLLVAVLFMGMLLGRGSGTDTPDSALEEREAREDAPGETREDPQPNPEPTTVPEPDPEPDPGELELSGTQSKVSDPFELSAGLLRVEASHEGEGSIWIDLVDATGESYSLIGDEGPFDVSQAEQIEEAGTYVVEVEAPDGGAWTVRLQQ